MPQLSAFYLLPPPPIICHHLEPLTQQPTPSSCFMHTTHPLPMHTTHPLSMHTQTPFSCTPHTPSSCTPHNLSLCTHRSPSLGAAVLGLLLVVALPELAAGLPLQSPHTQPPRPAHHHWARLPPLLPKWRYLELHVKNNEFGVCRTEERSSLLVFPCNRRKVPSLQQQRGKTSSVTLS